MPEKNNQTIDELREENFKELAANRKEAAILRARIVELEAQEQALKRQKIMTVGYAQAYCYVGKKCLRNIEEALNWSEDCGETREEAMSRWLADVAEEQELLRQGSFESISALLNRMKADDASGKSK